MTPADILAATVDPAPWTAWLVLIATALGILALAVGLVGWTWKRVGIPDVREAVRAELDRRDRDHAAEHTELEQRINAVRDGLGQQIDAVDKAREASIRSVHKRIDQALLGRP